MDHKVQEIVPIWVRYDMDPGPREGDPGAEPPAPLVVKETSFAARATKIVILRSFSMQMCGSLPVFQFTFMSGWPMTTLADFCENDIFDVIL